MLWLYEVLRGVASGFPWPDLYLAYCARGRLYGYAASAFKQEGSTWKSI